MMNKWHVNNNGETGKCEAQVSCRFGSHVHGDTPEEAMDKYAQINNLQKMTQLTKSKKEFNAQIKGMTFNKKASPKTHKLIHDMKQIKKEYKTPSNILDKKMKTLDKAPKNMIESVHKLRLLKK